MSRTRLRCRQAFVQALATLIRHNQDRLSSCLRQRSKPEGRRRASGSVHASATSEGGDALPEVTMQIRQGRSAGTPIAPNSRRTLEIWPVGLKFVAVSGWSNLVLVRPIAFHVDRGRGRQTGRALAGTKFPSTIEGRRRGYSSTPSLAFARFAGKPCSRRRWLR